MGNGFRLSLCATLLAFVVIVLGAYTRLTDAGLGCPDWPGCYGHLTVPKAGFHAHPIIDTTKAWTEMIHRYAAGSLGILIFGLVLLATRNRRDPEQPVALPIALGAVVFFQALLGMWTVTLKLSPIVVLAHLIGGLTTIALLWWLTLQLRGRAFFFETKNTSLRRLALGSLFILIVQTILGGWTSANYAALVCTDFPFCQVHWHPNFSASKVFNFTALDNDGRATIHMLHRIGALLTTILIGWFVFLIFVNIKQGFMRLLGMIIFLLLVLQILLGITNILARLPLPIAVAHNATATLLLLALLTFNFFLFSKPCNTRNKTI